ncbi:PREDICTED: tubulin polyglutamylase complex subunit 2-like [Amphimedon queenslandica]|uniref:Knr4/Smi1-like domain-containing protein n=1 Tax=Amphimedon queenslandica TaxID=400682 RepID=A0AAN0II32_AMPQE|nr:PREDICTED: tubulin polyglutamylase complex subunit 2-like [Amphimedon queenslandica]|eukprot:XP_003390307.1 PREDICTED: tubulin polyglutamylase complex subunit 2-like [Amphimedon queenslandica]
MFLSSLEKYILEQPGVVDVSAGYGAPLNQSVLQSWERLKGLTLTDDIRDFYMSHDGAYLIWKYNHNRNSIVLGNITINSLDDLSVFNPFNTCANTCTPSLYDLQDKNDDWDPFYCINNKIIIISSCPDTGHTCLVFDENSLFRGIWLIDLALNCHLMCDTFSDYLRLCQVHLGLIQWPYSLVGLDVSNHYKAWFEIFIPKRFLINNKEQEQDDDSSPVSVHLTTPNFSLYNQRPMK